MIFVDTFRFCYSLKNHSQWCCSTVIFFFNGILACVNSVGFFKHWSKSGWKQLVSGGFRCRGPDSMHLGIGWIGWFPGEMIFVFLHHLIAWKSSRPKLKKWSENSDMNRTEQMEVWCRMWRWFSLSIGCFLGSKVQNVNFPWCSWSFGWSMWRIPDYQGATSLVDLDL